MSKTPKPNVLDMEAIASSIVDANNEMVQVNGRAFFGEENPATRLPLMFVRTDAAANVLTMYTQADPCLLLAATGSPIVSVLLSSIMAFGFEVGREYGRREMSKEMETIMGMGEGEKE